MKTKFLLLILALIVAPISGHAQALTVAIQREAEKSTAALTSGNHAAVLAYTHDRVIELMGGKTTALSALQRSSEEMKSRGIAIVSAKISAPQEPEKIGPWVTSVVPFTLTMKVPNGRVVQRSNLLGLSEDEGRTWRFIDLGPIDDEKLFGLFPELRGKFRMPPKSAPVIEQKP